MYYLYGFQAYFLVPQEDLGTIDRTDQTQPLLPVETGQASVAKVALQETRVNRGQHFCNPSRIPDGS